MQETPNRRCGMLPEVRIRLFLQCDPAGRRPAKIQFRKIRSSAAAEERIFRNCILAGLRSAGSHCENSGSSDDTCASARSGSTKQRSLLCLLSERGCRHPLLFAVLDLLVLLDQAKSTRKESVRRKLFERSFAMRKLLCASRNDDYLLVSCF